jgi:hypothetical protein
VRPCSGSVLRSTSLCAVEVVLALKLDCVGLGSLVVAELPLRAPSAPYGTLATVVCALKKQFEEIKRTRSQARLPDFPGGIYPDVGWLF